MEAIDQFPKSRLRLCSDVEDLIPLDRDLLRDEDGGGYWDLSLSPGRVWSEAEDGDWSRAVSYHLLSPLVYALWWVATGVASVSLVRTLGELGFPLKQPKLEP